MFVHAYLLNHHFALKFGAASGPSLCDLSSTFNCSAVSASRFAEFLGVPLALWGLTANGLLLLLTLWFPLTDDEKRPAARRNLLIVAGAIALASVVMGGISAFALSQFCLFCIFTYGLSFLSFGLLWKGLPHHAPEMIRVSLSDFSSLAVLGAIALGGTFIARDHLAASYSGGTSDSAREMQLFAQEKVAQWKATPPRSIQTIDPLVLGAPAEQAKMTIVEFADFRCIHCKQASPTLKAFVSSRPDVRLEFQPWPLDGECNTAVPQPNGVSCMLARVAWCAEKKAAKGWLAHDWIFEQEIFKTTSEVEENLDRLASSAGLNSTELKDCVNSEESKSAIRSISDVGTSLNLQGTPSIFVNGALLPAGQSLPVLTEAYQAL